MQQIVTNSTVNGVLQAIFALLNDHRGRQRDPRSGSGPARGGLPTTEVPTTESRIVAPSDFFATRGGEGGRPALGGRAARAVRSGRVSAPAPEGALARVARGVRWYLRELTGEARYDQHVERCHAQGREPMSRRAFERHRADARERTTHQRCC